MAIISPPVYTLSPIHIWSLKYGAEIVAPVPEKPGYLFRSWSGYTEGMTVTGNATFTAFWVQYPAAPGYEIDVPSSVSNGSITASSPTANAGSIVILTVTPDEGYQLDQLTVTDAAGNALELTALGNGQYTFKMPYTAVEVSVSFKSTAVEEELPFAEQKEPYYWHVIPNGVVFKYVKDEKVKTLVKKLIKDGKDVYKRQGPRSQTATSTT